MSKWSVAKKIVTVLSERESDHGADSAGMLEALISTALTALAAEKDAAYDKKISYYEVNSINVQHGDAGRLTQAVAKTYCLRYVF